MNLVISGNYRVFYQVLEVILNFQKLVSDLNKCSLRSRTFNNKPSQSRVVELCARSGIVLALLLLLGEAGKKVPKSYPEAIEIAAEKKFCFYFLIHTRLRAKA